MAAPGPMRLRGAAAARAPPLRARRTARRHQPTRDVAVVARAEDDNPFVKLGSQLVQAGSQLTRTLTGTARVRRRGRGDDRTVFIAGANGRVGSRIVKECVLAGFNVRAGVRSAEKGAEMLEFIDSYGELKPRQLNSVKVVEFDLLQPQSFQDAIGNANTVISAVGAPESEIFNPNGPRSIDGEGSCALIEEAAALDVRRFIIVSSLGTTKFGFPASLLNLFWGVLDWKRKAEEALIRSGMAWTIVRPGGMERPQDDYKLTHCLTLYPRDTLSTGEISRLQVAELVAACAKNPKLASYKTLEVIGEEDAPRADPEELLDAIEPDISEEEAGERQAVRGNARKKVKTLQVELEESEAQLAEAEEVKVKAEAAFGSARGELQEVRAQTFDSLKDAERMNDSLSQVRMQLEAALRQEAAAREMLNAQRRAAAVLSKAELTAIADPILRPPPVEEEEEAPPPRKASRGFSLFGAPKEEVEAPKEEEEVQEEKKEEPKPSRGGGFFGMFQSAPKEVAPAKEEATEAPAPAKPAAKAAAPKPAPAKPAPKPVQKPPAPKPAPAPAAMAATPAPPAPAEKPAGDGAAAPAAAKAPEEVVPTRSAGLFGGLFGSSGTSSSSSSVAAPAAAPTAAPAANSADLEAKRSEAVAAALKNLNSAAATTRPESGKAKEPSTNGTPAKALAGKAGAKLWIKNWRAKQKA